jgi:acylglycerol lipase
MYRTFVARGFAVHAFDFVGHGRSGGDRGQWTDCALNVVDLHRFVCDTLALPRFERLPYFVVAKASGVILANHMIDRIMRDNFVRKPSGFCCISPAGKVKKTYSAAKKAVARFAAKVAPRMDVASVKVEFMNSIPAERVAYESDPLVYHGNFSSATAAALLKSIRDTDYSRIRCPVFVLAAELEQVVDADAGLVLYDTVPASSKLLKTYDACWHDLVREPQKEQVFNDIGNWMLAVLACAGPAPAGERVVVVTDAVVPAGHLSAQVPDSLIQTFALLAPLAAPNVAPWHCNAVDCNRVFGVEDDLLHHVRSAHMVSGPYRCFACQKEHSTIDDVQAHEHAKHKADTGALTTFAHSVVRMMHQANSDSASSSALPLLDSALQRRGSRLGFAVPPIGGGALPSPALRDLSPPVSPSRDDAAVSSSSGGRRFSGVPPLAGNGPVAVDSSPMSTTPPKPSRLSPRPDANSGTGSVSPPRLSPRVASPGPGAVALPRVSMPAPPAASMLPSPPRVSSPSVGISPRANGVQLVRTASAQSKLTAVASVVAPPRRPTPPDEQFPAYPDVPTTAVGFSTRSDAEPGYTVPESFQTDQPKF